MAVLMLQRRRMNGFAMAARTGYTPLARVFASKLIVEPSGSSPMLYTLPRRPSFDVFSLYAAPKGPRRARRRSWAKLRKSGWYGFESLESRLLLSADLNYPADLGDTFVTDLTL